MKASGPISGSHSLWRGGFGAVLMLATALGSSGAEEPDPAAQLPQTRLQPVPDSARFSFSQTGPGQFVLGRVAVDKTRRQVHFPVRINQRSGVVEYALVSSRGKTHESVFQTDVEPEQVHLGLLLLGVHAANTNMFPSNLTEPIPGEKVRVVLEWSEEGRNRSRSVEEFIVTTNNQKPLSAGPWIYNGSFIHEGVFMAQADGSFISVHIDPAALINNPRPGRENDDLHFVNTAALPADSAVLRMSIGLEGIRAPSAGQNLPSPAQPRDQGRKAPP